MYTISLKTIISKLHICSGNRFEFITNAQNTCKQLSLKKFKRQGEINITLKK